MNKSTNSIATPKRDVNILLLFCYALLAWLILPGFVSAENLDWLLDCNHKKAGFDYYSELDKLKHKAVSRSEIVAVIRRDLPHQLIGYNSECIYDAILLFADNSVVSLLKKRRGLPNQADELGYVEDLIRLLETRPERYGDQATFEQEISSYHHTVSVQHFFDLHLDDMPVHTQLTVILAIIQKKKLPGHYHYSVPVFLKRIHAGAPREYDEFVSSLSEVPAEFTCIKDDSCP